MSLHHNILMCSHHHFHFLLLHLFHLFHLLHPFLPLLPKTLSSSNLQPACLDLLGLEQNYFQFHHPLDFLHLYDRWLETILFGLQEFFHNQVLAVSLFL